MAFSLVLTITLISIFLTLTYAPLRVPAIAISGIVLLAITVPTFGPAQDLQLLTVGGSLAIALAGVVRTFDSVEAKPRVNGFLIVYVAYAAIIAALYSSPTAAAFGLGIAALLVMLIVLARRASAVRGYFPPLIAVIVIVQAVLSLSEFLGADAFWPRPDGSDRLESRVNHFAPWLPGRALGSLAGPIPLGTIAAIGVIASLWMIVGERRKRYWWVLGAAMFALLASGTRSALIACIVVIAVWIVSRSSASRPVAIALAVVGGAAFLLSTDILSTFGLNGFEESTSYIHRTEVISSMSAILTQQPPLAVLFGNGDNARDLLTNGIVETTTGVTVFDNQLVRELAASGVIGVLALAAAIILGLRLGDGLSRMIIVFTTMMFMSFDALTWRSVAVFFVIACCGPLGGLVGKPARASSARGLRPLEQQIR